MAVDSRKNSFNELPSLNNNLRLSLSASSSPSSSRKSTEEWSPKSVRKHRSKEDEPRRKQQLEAYQGWVNSQLKKLPGSRHIMDLQEDMRDGVALIQLVQVVAGDVLTVNENPTSIAEMRENVDRFLHFMAAKRIRMHRTTAKDIVDGNLKAIMRLILALAAHFKPGSVKQAIPLSATPGSKLVRKPSAAAAAQEAAAALADARGANASTGLFMRSRHRHRPSSPTTLQTDSSLSLRNVPLKSKTAVARRARDLGERFVDGRTDSSGNTSGTTTPIRSDRSASPSSLDDDSVEDSVYRVSWEQHSRQSSNSTWSEFSDEQERVVEDIKETKGRLLELQELLLSGRLPCEGEEEANDAEEDIIESSSILEQITILNARLDQRNAEYDNLKAELNDCKEECLNLHGVRSGLEARHLEQDQIIMQLKAEVLRLNFSQDSSTSLITDLKKELKDRESEISHMRSELSKRDKLVERQKSEMEHAMRRSDSRDGAEGDSHHKARQQMQEGSNKALRQQLKELQHRLDISGDVENDLSSRLHNQHHKMSALEERILHMTPMTTQLQTVGVPTSEEVDAIQDTLSRLRQGFKHNDPQLHQLEALEQSIVSLVDRVQASADLSNHSKRNGLDCPDLVPEQSLPRKSHDPVSSRRGTEIASSSTKVLYFTERTVTPFLTSLPKRLGEITLGDFKKIFDRTGNYRFHFKALDPEFGTVKEEVVNNDDIIPGWEGKIVAWVEEDTGQKTTL